MNSIEKIIIIPITLIFICYGLSCIFMSEWAYKYNLRQVEGFAKLVRNLPILGFLARTRADQTKQAGTLFIRIWGIFAFIMGLLVLFVLLTQ